MIVREYCACDQQRRSCVRDLIEAALESTPATHVHVVLGCSALVHVNNGGVLV